MVIAWMGSVGILHLAEALVRRMNPATFVARRLRGNEYVTSQLVREGNYVQASLVDVALEIPAILAQTPIPHVLLEDALGCDEGSMEDDGIVVEQVLSQAFGEDRLVQPVLKVEGQTAVVTPEALE